MYVGCYQGGTRMTDRPNEEDVGDERRGESHGEDHTREDVVVVGRDEVDHEAFESLVVDAAYLLRDGIVSIEDCSVQSLLEEGEVASEDLQEAFRTAVAERAERIHGRQPDPEPEPASEGAAAQSTVDPEAIDWVHLWTESNVDPDEPLSRPQLRLAVDVSTQTPISDVGADDFIDEALAAGVLEFDDAGYRPVRRRVQ